VTVSPGVTMFLPNVLARFADRRLSTMSTSPSESNLPWLDESLSYSGAAGAGGRIVMAIATDRNAPFQDLYTVSGAAWAPSTFDDTLFVTLQCRL